VRCGIIYAVSGKVTTLVDSSKYMPSEDDEVLDDEFDENEYDPYLDAIEDLEAIEAADDERIIIRLLREGRVN